MKIVVIGSSGLNWYWGRKNLKGIGQETISAWGGLRKVLSGVFKKQAGIFF